MMDCAQLDWKAYALGEVSPSERREWQAHAHSCGRCQEELARLEHTLAALGALREEEMPRRIAFVSDKVFEPSWWQRLWQPGPRLTFAAATMLSAAVVFHAATRPAPVAAPKAAPPVQTAGLTEEQIQQRVDDAVAKAVAAVEQRQQQRTAALLAASDKKYELDRRALLVAMDGQYMVMQKTLNQAIKDYAGLSTR
jgi:anti-sigma factor RsiW